MTDNLLLLRRPQDSTSRAYFSPVAPFVGDLKWSTRSTDAYGWMVCDGRSLSVQEHPYLFDVIGYSFGGEDDTFNLPDPRGRVPGIIGAGSGLTSRDLGDVTGSERHTLSLDEMPAHTHSGTTSENGSHTHTSNSTTSLGLMTNSTGGSNTADSGDGGVGEPNVFASAVQLAIDSVSNHSHTYTTSTRGADASHNNMQPTIFLGNILIFVEPFYEPASNQ